MGKFIDYFSLVFFVDFKVVLIIHCARKNRLWKWASKPRGFCEYISDTWTTSVCVVRWTRSGQNSRRRNKHLLTFIAGEISILALSPDFQLQMYWFYFFAYLQHLFHTHSRDIFRPLKAIFCLFLFIPAFLVRLRCWDGFVDDDDGVASSFVSGEAVVWIWKCEKRKPATFDVDSSIRSDENIFIFHLGLIFQHEWW